MKELKKRMPKIIAAACSLVLVLSAVLMPMAANAALPRPSSIPTPSGAAYTTSYENGVYTIDLDAAYIGNLLQNGDISKEDIKDRLPDSVYLLLVDRDPTAMKNVLYDLAKKAAQAYLDSMEDDSSAGSTATPKARSAAPATSAAASGSLLDRIPDGLVITAENLDTLINLVQNMIDNGVVTVEELNDMVDPVELQTILGVSNNAEGNPPTVEEYLSGAYNDEIVATAPTAGDIKTSIDSEKVAKIQISKKDLAIMMLNSLKKEAVVLLALFQDEFIDLMSRVEAIRVNNVTVFGGDAKLSVTGMEEAILAAIPSIEGISANLGAEGEYAEFASVTISVLTVDNQWHTYTARIRFAGSVEDRAVLKSYVDKIARFGSCRYDATSGAFILDINLPDGFLPLCVSAVDETRMPDSLKEKLGDVATLDFSDSANTPAIVNAIIHNLTLTDFADFLECVDVYQVAPGVMASFEARTGLNSNHVETARRYLIRSIGATYQLAERYDRYGATDKVADLLAGKRLDQLNYTGNGTFTVSKTATLDLMNLAELVSTLPDRDLSDEVDKLGNVADRVENKVENVVDNKLGDGTVDRVENKVENGIEDLTGVNVNVDVSRIIQKIFGMPYDKVFEKYPALANKVRNLPEYVDRFLTDTTLTHTVTVNVNFEDLYRVEYIKEGNVVHFDYLPEGYEIANIDPTWAPDGWADKNGLVMTAMPAADLQLAALRTVTFETYLRENGVDTFYKTESFRYTELADPATIAPAAVAPAGYGDWVWDLDWATLGLPADADITIKGYAELAPIDLTISFEFGGKTYSFQISGTIRDSLLELLNGSTGAAEMLADYPGYSLEWYYRIPTKSRAISAPAGYSALGASMTVPADGNIQVYAIPVANTYNVTFKGEDGTVLGTGSFTADDARADGLATSAFNADILKNHILTLAPTDVDKIGYTYEWNVPALAADTLGDIEVTLAYTVVDYTATFRVGGTDLGTIVFNIENFATKLAKDQWPALTDYAGYEWPDADYTTAFEAKDITVDAVAIDYTATFQVDGVKVGEIIFNVENFATKLAKDQWPALTDYAGYEWPDADYTTAFKAEDFTVEAELIDYTATFRVDGEEIGTIVFNAKDYATKLAKDQWPALTNYAGYEWPDADYTTAFKAEDFTVEAELIDYTATFQVAGKTVGTIVFNVKDYITALAEDQWPALTDYAGYKWPDADYTAAFKAEDFTVDAIAIDYTATFKVDGTKVGEIVFNAENFATKLAKDQWPALTDYAGYEWPDTDHTAAFKAEDITVDAVATEYTATFTVAGKEVGTIKFTVKNYNDVMAKAQWPAITTAGYAWPADVPAFKAENMTIAAVATEYTATFTVAGKEVGTIKFTVENYNDVMAKAKWPAITTAGYAWPADAPAFKAENMTIAAVATEYTATFTVAGETVGTIKFTVENYNDVMAKAKWPAIQKVGYEWPVQAPAFEAKDITIAAVLIDYVADFGYIDGDTWKSLGTVTFNAENYAAVMAADKLPALPEIEGYDVTGWNVPATFEEAVAALDNGKLLVQLIKTDKVPVETESDTDPDTDTETDPATGAPTDSETDPGEDDKKGFPWWILLIILIIIGILLILFFSRKDEPEEEPAPEPEPEPEIEAEPEVVEEKAPLFVPLGEEIPEEDDDFEIVEAVSAENVDDMMTDTTAQHLMETAVEAGGVGKIGIINVGQISDAYEAGETVDLASLQAKGLVPDNIGRLKVLAAGTLNKPLTVKADAFSVQAVKMITLTGGHAAKLSGDQK